MVREIAVRFLLILASVSFSITSAPVFGESQTLEPLWQKAGVSLVRTACKPDISADLNCRAIDLRVGSRTRQLGTGYMLARLIWSAHGGHRGPDALVIGESGGSGGYAELFAVTVGRNNEIKKLNGERLEGLRATSNATTLQIDLPFDLEFFNGAPHSGATIVPIPTIWRNGDFSADMSALVQPPMPNRELEFRELAIRQELHEWADAKFPSPRLFPPESDQGTPVTLAALLNLMLTGHADQAHELLGRSWPQARGRSDGQLGGEKDFWRAICQTTLRNPLWVRLRLDRLPHADLIRAGAV